MLMKHQHTREHVEVLIKAISLKFNENHKIYDENIAAHYKWIQHNIDFVHTLSIFDEMEWISIKTDSEYQNKYLSIPKK